MSVTTAGLRVPPSLAPLRSDAVTIGGRIARTSAALGEPLMPWQRLAADIGGERLPDGRPRFSVVVVSTPRQAGKSTLGRAVCAEGMTSRNEARVWSTAQTRNAARDRWNDAARALRRSAAFGPHVDLRLANGSESLSLPNGSSWRPFAPLPDALHGETTTRVLIDEAWSFDRVRGTELLQAIVPTGAAVPDFQLWIVSAAGTERSEFLADFLAAGHAMAGDASGLCVIAWQTTATEGTPDLVEQVIRDHPAVGHTVTADKVREAAEVLDEREFLRAFGNVWTASTVTLFSADKVEAVTVGATQPPTRPARIALAGDVAPDRTSAAIAAAWLTSADDVPTIALVGHGHGVGWSHEAAARLTRRYGVPLTLDPIGPTAGLADDLRRQGVNLRTLTTRDVTTAAADLLDAVDAGTVRLVADDALRAALSIAARRSVGRDAWAYDRKGAAGDLSPLIAAAHALYALRRPASEPYLL